MLLFPLGDPMMKQQKDFLSLVLLTVNPAPSVTKSNIAGMSCSNSASDCSSDMISSGSRRILIQVTSRVVGLPSPPATALLLPLGLPFVLLLGTAGTLLKRDAEETQTPGMLRAVSTRLNCLRIEGKLIQMWAAASSVNTSSSIGGLWRFIRTPVWWRRGDTSPVPRPLDSLRIPLAR